MRYVTARAVAEICQVSEAAIHYRIKSHGFDKVNGNIGISERDARFLLRLYANKGSKKAGRYLRMEDPFQNVVKEVVDIE